MLSNHVDEMLQTVLFVFYSLSGTSTTFLKGSIYVYLVPIAQRQEHTFPDFWHFSDFSLTTFKYPDFFKFSRLVVVIISITWYPNIDRRFVKRTISRRPYIVRYRARTHVSRVRCSHAAAAASASDCLMLLAVHTVCGSLCLTFPAADLSCSALGAWGGDWGTAVAPVVG